MVRRKHVTPSQSAWRGAPQAFVRGLHRHPDVYSKRERDLPNMLNSNFRIYQEAATLALQRRTKTQPVQLRSQATQQCHAIFPALRRAHGTIESNRQLETQENSIGVTRFHRPYTWRQAYIHAAINRDPTELRFLSTTAASVLRFRRRTHECVRTPVRTHSHTRTPPIYLLPLSRT